MGNLDYSFSTARSVAYETNFRLGILSFVASAATDNLVGKIDKVLGYIGVSGFSIRVAENYIRGKASWEGMLAYDMKPEFRFRDRMRTIDLLYTGGDDFKWFPGLGYMDLTFPMGFSVTNNETTASGNKTVKSPQSGIHTGDTGKQQQHVPGPRRKRNCCWTHLVPFIYPWLDYFRRGL